MSKIWKTNLQLTDSTKASINSQKCGSSVLEPARYLINNMHCYIKPICDVQNVGCQAEIVADAEVGISVSIEARGTNP